MSLPDFNSFTLLSTARIPTKAFASEVLMFKETGLLGSMLEALKVASTFCLTSPFILNSMASAITSDIFPTRMADQTTAAHRGAQASGIRIVLVNEDWAPPTAMSSYIKAWPLLTSIKKRESTAVVEPILNVISSPTLGRVSLGLSVEMERACAVLVCGGYRVSQNSTPPSEMDALNKTLEIFFGISTLITTTPLGPVVDVWVL